MSIPSPSNPPVTPRSQGGGVNYAAASPTSTQDVRQLLEIELGGKTCTSPDVLDHYLRFNTRSPEEVQWLGDCQRGFRESTSINGALDTLRTIDRASQKKKKEKKQNELGMYPPLDDVFRTIEDFCNAPRTFSNTHGASTTFEDEFPGFNAVQPDFVLRKKVADAKAASKILWRTVLACVEVKCSRTEAPHQDSERNLPRPAKPIVGQVGDYARIQLANRPFQLFSMCLLIYGPFFNISVYDRGGVIHSPSYAMYDKDGFTADFIFVIRRLLVDLSVWELGREPLVRPPVGQEEAIATKVYAPLQVPEIRGQPMSTGGWRTRGGPIWTSYSLVGRGTAVWMVTADDVSHEPYYIMKTAWRHTDRKPEAAIYDYLRSKNLLGRRGIADFLAGNDVSFTRADGTTVPLSVNALRPVDAFLGDDIVLHRVILTSVGRPLWQFEDGRHLARALLAIAKGIEALRSHGILHRDISIGNVLLSDDTREGHEAFLTDFEFASIEDWEVLEATTDDRNEVVVVQMPGHKTLPAVATNSHTRWTVKRGPQMTGTLQFMALGMLANVAKYYNLRKMQPSTTSSFALKLTKHEVKHDFESLVWVADYAVYRRVFEQTLNLPQDSPVRRSVAAALKENYGPAQVTKIMYVRTATLYGAMNPAMQLPSTQAILDVIDTPLVHLRRALLVMAWGQNSGSLEGTGAKPDMFGSMMATVGFQGGGGAGAGQELTCSQLETLLLDYLKRYY